MAETQVVTMMLDGYPPIVPLQVDRAEGLCSLVAFCGLVSVIAPSWGSLHGLRCGHVVGPLASRIPVFEMLAVAAFRGSHVGFGYLA